ncbi:hypothetical protein [uncultured Thiodictyon sp.]|uniref:ImmA/IrrE family metallo-endopeptidase n=1 Tax=uncultured Thiodictyon sp. TaxID=1846217 RepID=UPI0025F10D77|nr:hypothetical protein [uncultured Thiodictyon sp.]
MSAELTIGLDWERLEEGLPEEKSCFGMLQVCFGNILLTEGQDGFIDCARRGPLVSGYHLAEWLAWNWWRLTREPRPDAPNSDWHFAHCLGTVGAGYLWPNITIASDRQRTLVIAKPTRPQGFSAFRFTAHRTLVMPTSGFESALDLFMGQIQGKLRADRVAPTNFDQIWTEVLAERADPDTASQRELEAVLGYDADEGDAGQVRQLLGDADDLGHDAIIEIAADHRPGHGLPTAAEIRSWATDFGRDTRPADIPRITGLDLRARSTTPAWRQGYQGARTLREQHGLAHEPLPDKRLAELCAVSPEILEPAQPSPLAFVLDDDSHRAGRVVLRSNYPTGRRFELARLLGDRIAGALDEHLIPVTRSHTYRQKLQRAFAAELLCPFEALEAFLDGDYSEQARDDAAQHFNVSERAVWTLLVNNDRLERNALDDDAETLGAAA